MVASAARELRLRRDPDDANPPSLDECDEYVEAPGVGPAVPLGGDSAFTGYTRVYHRIVGQLGADTTFALLLLMLHALIALAYGVSEAARITATVPVDAGGPLPDMLVRVWRPLALYEVMTAGLVAVAHWVGFLVAVRSAGMATSSGGFTSSWALASVPGTVCLGFVWFAGGTVQSMAIPSVLTALPIVVLFTCAIFGVRLVMGLILALVCMALAGPASVFSARMYGRYAANCSMVDEQRIVTLQSAQPVRSAQPTGPQIAQGEDGLPGLASANPRVKGMAGALMASAGAANPAASQPGFPQATSPAKPEPVPPAAQVPEVTSGVSLTAWSQPESVQQVIWPAVTGEHFATLSADALGNHVVELWLARDLSAQGSLRIGGGPAISYALSPSGKLLVRVISTASPIAEAWNTKTSRRQMQVSLAGGSGTPAALGFVDDTTFAIVWRGQSRLMVSVYDGQSGALSRTIPWPDAEKRTPVPGQGGQGAAVAHPEAVWLSPDGKLLAGVDATPRIAVLETAGGRPVEQWRVNLPAGQVPPVSGIAFSPGNGRIAVLLDENQNNGQSVLFIAEPGVTDLTAIPFSSAVWRLAGCSGPSGRRGRVIDWISDSELLLYGELVVDVTSGALTRSMHPREPGKPPRGGAFSQYPLLDGSFLLEPNADTQGKKPALQRLRMDRTR